MLILSAVAPHVLGCNPKAGLCSGLTFVRHLHAFDIYTPFDIYRTFGKILTLFLRVEVERLYIHMKTEWQCGHCIWAVCVAWIGTLPFFVVGVPFLGNCPVNCPHFIVCNLHLSGLCQACTKRLFTDHIVWRKQAFWNDVARWAPVWSHTPLLRAGHLSILLSGHMTHIFIGFFVSQRQR